MRLAYHCNYKACGVDFMLDTPTPVPLKSKKAERDKWEGVLRKAVEEHHKQMRPACGATLKDLEIMLPEEAQK